MSSRSSQQNQQPSPFQDTLSPNSDTTRVVIMMQPKDNSNQRGAKVLPKIAVLTLSADEMKRLEREL